MDTHDALSVAVQLHPPGIETAMEPVVAAASIETPVGEMVEVHGTPSCVTVNA